MVNNKGPNKDICKRGMCVVLVDEFTAIVGHHLTGPPRAIHPRLCNAPGRCRGVPERSLQGAFIHRNHVAVDAEVEQYKKRKLHPECNAWAPIRVLLI